MYDVIIIGAGPAGSTLARLIGGKYKVLILDKRELCGPEEDFGIEKCCGGLLAPDAQYMIAKLGLSVPKKILTGPQLFTVRTIDLDNNTERFYQRHYINVDREKFDRWLVSLIPSRVVTNFGCHYKSFEQENEKIKVKFTKNGKEYFEYTNILVGADGAFSLVRKHAFPHTACPETYVSVQEWYKVDHILPYYSSIFDTSITDFYSWTIPKDDYLIIGSAINSSKDINTKFELLKSKLKKYGYTFNNKYKRNGAFILRPKKLNQISTGKGRVALIGEAAGWISPSSAEGISYSFKSALALAESIDEDFNNFVKLYKSKTSYIRRNIIIKNLKSPFMYNSLLRNSIMRSGILSMNIMKSEQ